MGLKLSHVSKRRHKYLLTDTTRPRNPCTISTLSGIHWLVHTWSIFICNDSNFNQHAVARRRELIGYCKNHYCVGNILRCIFIIYIDSAALEITYGCVSWHLIHEISTLDRLMAWHLAWCCRKLVGLPQIAKSFGSTLMIHQLETKVSDRSVIDGDPRVFALGGYLASFGPDYLTVDVHQKLLRSHRSLWIRLTCPHKRIYLMECHNNFEDAGARLIDLIQWGYCIFWE